MSVNTLKHCSGCNAGILWMDTESGRRIPINFEERHLETKAFNNKTMTAHFATCPQAAKFRKRRSSNG